MGKKRNYLQSLIQEQLPFTESFILLRLKARGVFMNAADGLVAMALHTADDIRICDGVCVCMGGIKLPVSISVSRKTASGSEVSVFF